MPSKSAKSSASLDYLQAIRAVLEHLERTQLRNIERAADFVVHALTHGGVVRCSEIGHGIQGDFIQRAGGLAAVQPFHFTFNLPDHTGPAKQRPAAKGFERDLETVRLAVQAANFRAGDVLLIASVSGKNRAPVELALACRKLGVRTVGFTSLAYTAQVEALHPSGKKLADAVDVVIDNGAPYGDAAVSVSGLREKAMPVSGVAMDVAGWMLWGRVMERMTAAGKKPTVFLSVNRPGGMEAYRRSLKRYEKLGY